MLSELRISQPAFPTLQASGSDNIRSGPPRVHLLAAAILGRLDIAEQNDTSPQQALALSSGLEPGCRTDRGHHLTNVNRMGPLKTGTIYRVGGPLVANRLILGTNQGAQVASGPRSGAGQPENIASGTVQSDNLPFRARECASTAEPQLFSASPLASSLQATLSGLHTLLDTRAERRNNTTLACPASQVTLSLRSTSLTSSRRNV